MRMASPTQWSKISQILEHLTNNVRVLLMNKYLQNSAIFVKLPVRVNVYRQNIRSAKSGVFRPKAFQQSVLRQNVRIPEKQNLLVPSKACTKCILLWELLFHVLNKDSFTYLNKYEEEKKFPSINKRQTSYMKIVRETLSNREN